ncbi:NlpC/P60 family protein [Streptomyces sp. NPDC057298]|uniref:C40 family peptidase n=1 Tax=Streptomyces sp. NPDC057298 TaxID=3346091 RepID=UPI0036267EBF
MSRSALVKAAPTSVDQFSPAGSAVPAQRGDEPSREEVQQRISNLYDRVESASGNFNATRAMAAVKGETVRPKAESRAGRATAAAAPLVDVAKQWFDVGRAQLGPAFPAVLPPDRGQSGTPSAGPGGRPAGGAGGRGREAADKPVLELTAGPTAGAGPVAELTAGPSTGALPALPAVPAPRQEAGSAPSKPAAGPTQASLKASKQRMQRKIGQARELLSGHVARQAAPIAAIESRPAEAAWRPAEEQLLPGTGETPWQQAPTAFGTGQYTGGELYAGTDTRVGTDMRAGTDMYTGAGTYTGAGVAADQYLGGDMYLGTDRYAGAGTYTDTGAYPGAGTYAGTGTYSDTGSYPGLSLYADTSTPLGAGSALDTGVPLGVQGVSDAGYGGKAARAVDFARAQIGKPCVWGATGPDSYDCSSLTQAAWRAAGVALPRSVHDQATAGTAVPVTDMRIGDLVLFHGHVGHIGLYTGNGMMIHAPSPGAAIREESVYWAGESAIHGAVRPA